MEREQFTFYASFARAIQRIRKAADRAAAYDAIVNYALFEVEPDLDNMPDSVCIVFDLIRPNLDTSRRKAQGGKAVRQAEDAAKIPQRPDEDSANKNKKEKENKKEYKNKSISAHAHGQYGWVKLTDEQYEKLVADLGKEEAERCIAYVDESAQSTGNKNHWKDWNLTVRKCSRDGWGLYGVKKQTAPSSPKPVDMDALRKVIDKI